MNDDDEVAFGPTDAEVAQVLDAIRQRVRRLLRRRGLEPGDEDIGPEDPLAEASLALAGIVGASVQGRVALGRRTGARVRRLGHGPTAVSDAPGPRHARAEGFDLHANVWVGAHDRARREQLCRYLLRPPLADDRLRLLGDGRVRVQLKRAWSDRHDAPALRACGVTREGGGADAATGDEPDSGPRRPRSVRTLATCCGRLRSPQR